MTLSARVELAVAKPPSVVFEAIIDPEKMAKYFITSGDRRMAAGQVVRWCFDDHGGAKLDVKVLELDADRRVAFLWPATGADTRVDVRLTAAASGTTVEVTEGTWAVSDEGISGLTQQTQGWMHFLCCLKAWLEHGINLRGH